MSEDNLPILPGDEAYEEEYDGGNTISFLTAWAPPHEVIEALSEQFPGVYFTHRWAEEELKPNDAEERTTVELEERPGRELEERPT